jgi:hypothetical protein
MSAANKNKKSDSGSGNRDRGLRKWRRYAAACRGYFSTVPAVRLEPDLGQLNVWNDEFVFAWFFTPELSTRRPATAFIEENKSNLFCMAHDDCREHHAIGMSCIAPLRDEAIRALDEFLKGRRTIVAVFEKNIPRSRTRAQSSYQNTVKPFWRLEYINGMPPRGAGMLRDFYCARNVTSEEMAYEIASFRAQFCTREQLEEQLVFLARAPEREWWRSDVHGSKREWSYPATIKAHAQKK